MLLAVLEQLEDIVAHDHALLAGENVGGTHFGDCVDCMMDWALIDCFWGGAFVELGTLIVSYFNWSFGEILLVSQ